ncbi:molybdopterin molybdotransferase MoeA [Pseudomonas sp. ZM23]|uniref:Molybdopterin molybdenumtransferase n=1 Tax=Pseudomonas triclosanedens TaxID=2961893 RepID=A0ABY6ZUK8_9PSED|nr:gephyrin-like molybdotransferase Glp [Pseudomonas triclosanedens]MCP8463306.1 molybdopterin molybdotransferase MoeA [Pseudomonas triclosanedens]MCP8469635.1 molybdopterin molybdotransferase MoeA [Pseudomonas triclosanedens]MCP8474107.1 molybdopterin molybdotransferase MoeA [Pseudomonas triclosanedens]WAI48501.1 molybdopterin molybdotransferase MoeA [Pseudomonas triclosanedens]
MNGCGCSGAGLRPVDEAIAALMDFVPPPPPVVRVDLEQALGRVLAEDIRSPLDLPLWDNSAMDGYALRAADTGADGARLRVAGCIAAGQSSQVELQPGETMRIFTGAPLPPGADCVVAQEDCQADGQWLQVPRVDKGNHVRPRGEEVCVGDPLLAPGRKLRAQELGLLASVGFDSVAVFRRLRVCLLSSGDELREPGESLAPGQIYNANRFSLGALLRSWGMEVHDYGVLADTLAASRDALSLAASEWDVLVTSGGVSVGDRDCLKQAIRELGELHLWKLNMQPGKPLAFGSISGKPWIGLPGNPAAALVTALVVARPFLWRAQGRDAVEALPATLPAGFDWPAPNSRRQYLRSRVELDARGFACITPHPQQGSAMLRTASWADGLAIVEAGRTLRAGEPLPFLSFSELGA